MQDCRAFQHQLQDKPVSAAARRCPDGVPADRAAMASLRSPAVGSTSAAWDPSSVSPLGVKGAFKPIQPQVATCKSKGYSSSKKGGAKAVGAAPKRRRLLKA